MTDPESDLRDRLQRCNADMIAALARYDALYKQHNALSHEVERLREGRADAPAYKPSVVILCESAKSKPDEPMCWGRLELTPLHDTDVPVLVRLAGWGVNEKGERLCKRCKEGL